MVEEQLLKEELFGQQLLILQLLILKLPMEAGLEVLVGLFPLYLPEHLFTLELMLSIQQEQVMDQI